MLNKSRNMSQQYRNPILDKDFKPRADKWYNLSTGMFIIKNTANERKYEMIDSPVKVAGLKVKKGEESDEGEKSQISQFLQANDISAEESGEPEGVEGEKRAQKVEKPKAEKKVEKKAEKKVPQRLKIVVAKDRFRPKSTDVRDLPEDEIKNICDFDLRGLQTWARVVNVKDGDTLDLCYFISSDFIEFTRKLSSRSKIAQRNGLVYTGGASTEGETPFGYFTVSTCRLNGVDAMEHDTKQGQEAIRLFALELQKTNNIVWCHFIKYEKYGRGLVELYKDSDMKEGINRFYIGKKHPLLGILYEEYGGGAKSEYTKNLPKVPSKKPEDKMLPPTKTAIKDKTPMKSGQASVEEVCLIPEEPTEDISTKFSEEEIPVFKVE